MERFTASWKKEDNLFTLKVKIPVGCNATVAIPQADPGMITENDMPITGSGDVKVISSSDGKTFCKISSGEYHFKATYIK